MKYKESAQVSAEYLRLALPLIAEHGAAVNPINYAVWYEYVAQTCPPLQEEIDALRNENEKITDEQCERLFSQYISGTDEVKLSKLQEAMQRLLKEMNATVSEADSQALRFDNSLEDYGSRLDDQVELSVLHQIIQGILNDTRSMRESNAALRSQLNQSSKEVNVLREELGRARKEALTDPLTGLTNRKGFTKAAEEAIVQSESTKGLSLLLLDLDHFKRVNDTYGHLLGDKVLKLVAATLRKSVKGQDTPVRHGGEEFAVLLPDTDLEGAIALADNIRKTIKAGKIRRTDNGQLIGTVTVSVGVSHFRQGEPLEEFFSRADTALYQSKATGRDRVTSEAELGPLGSEPPEPPTQLLTDLR